MVDFARLGRGDASRLEELNAFFARVFSDQDIKDCDGASQEQRARWLESDSHVALVALAEQEIVGGLVAYRFDKIEGRREFYIYDLAVDENHRRSGIATRLIDDLCGIARNAGAWVAYVQSFKQEDPAVALYTKIGAREEILHFDIDPSGRMT